LTADEVREPDTLYLHGDPAVNECVLGRVEVSEAGAELEHLLSAVAFSVALCPEQCLNVLWVIGSDNFFLFVKEFSTKVVTHVQLNHPGSVGKKPILMDDRLYRKCSKRQHSGLIHQ